METRKRALGKGLEQLFNSEAIDVNELEKQIYETTPKEEIVELDIKDLRPNPYQPRTVFNEEHLQELASSIKEHGVFQPIIVKKSIKGYDIIAGERRYRASKMAGLTKIPAIIRTFTDGQMMEIALLENLQRENLSPIEEAKAYQSMIDHLHLTQDELSKKVGKSRSHLTNMLGLLRLPKEVQTLVNDEKLSMGHARALSKLENTEEIIQMAHEITEKKLPVRAVEEKINEGSFEKKVKMKRQDSPLKENYKHAEDLLRDRLDAKVRIHSGKIEIQFTNQADLNRILDIIQVKES